MIDLRPHFKNLHWRPMPHSFGVNVASDWADKADDDPVFGIFKQCGLWCMDEVQILHECAKAFPWKWLDIGCHTGWTTAHIGAGGCDVIGIDPMLSVAEFRQRLVRNTIPLDEIDSAGDVFKWSGTGNVWFANLPSNETYNGVCIDGDHDPGAPLSDAINAVNHLAERGVILFHDAMGLPVQEAAEYCVAQGFQCRAYPTVHGVAVCWRGDFTPPEHTVDPRCACVADRIGALKRFV